MPPRSPATGGGCCCARGRSALDGVRNWRSWFRNKRAPTRVVHSRLEQIRQRVFQIALGYEDQDDATSLRTDPLARAMCDRLPDDELGLSSQPTLSRLEHAVRARDVARMQQLLEDDYVCSLPDSTTVVLDIDSTDDPTHGQQPFSSFMVTGLRRGGPSASVRLRPGNAGNHRSARR